MSAQDPVDHDHPVDPQRVAAVRDALVDVERIDESAGLMAVLGEPVRQRVVRALLTVPELCVGDLALALGVPEDSITYAVRVLRDTGLVQRRRKGRFGYYRLTDGAVVDAIEAFEQLVPVLKRGGSDAARG